MRFSEINRKIVEGYKLQLERDADMMVLNITDTATGKRTEVRGKAGYETNGYDKNDKLHQLLDKISKTANISELMNGEPVGINPNTQTVLVQSLLLIPHSMKKLKYHYTVMLKKVMYYLRLKYLVMNVMLVKVLKQCKTLLIKWIEKVLLLH